MIFSLRRKRPTTVPAKNTRSRKACSLAGILLLSLTSAGFGQAKPEFAQPTPWAGSKPTTKVVRAQAAEPMGEPYSSDETRQYQILLEPPSPEALFGRLESEKGFEQRMRQQARQQTPPGMVQFPDKPVLSKTDFPGRSFPPQVIFAEPRFVCHHRLYFEEKNAERYGWDFGIIQPLVSTLYFYRDVVFLPHNIASHPHRRYECSAGYCLPGDPIPYILYPPEFTLVGGIAEGVVAVGLFAAIP